MLRRQLGDTIFHQIIKTYYETYKGKNADTKDLQSVAEKVSGKRLETFFNQWLYNPGTPELDISWKYNDSEKKISFTITQTQKGTLFEFPLEISVQQKSGSEPKKFILPIHKKTGSFDFSISSKPIRVIADPGTSLLFEGRLKEVKN